MPSKRSSDGKAKALSTLSTPSSSDGNASLDEEARRMPEQRQPLHSSDATTTAGVILPETDSNSSGDTSGDNGPNGNSHSSGAIQLNGQRNEGLDAAGRHVRIRQSHRPESSRDTPLASKTALQTTNERPSQSQAEGLSPTQDEATAAATVAASASNTDMRKLTRWQKVRATCGAIVDNPTVQLLTIGLIVINAILMGIATFDFVTDSPTVSQGFETADRAILVVFTVEIALQLIYHGLAKVLTDGWLCFDLIVVISSWSLESITIIRAFRVFRVFRLITRLSTLKKLVQALFEVTPAVSAITALLLLIMYIYAVLCTTLFGGLYEEGVTDIDYFGRLDTSMLTLLQFVTLDWAPIVRQITNRYYWATIVFVTFLTFTSIILYSLIVAVVCDAVSTSEHANDPPKQAEMDHSAAMEQIEQLQQRVTQLTRQQEQLSTALQLCLNELVKRPAAATATSGRTSMSENGDDDAADLFSMSEASFSDGEDLGTEQQWTGVATGRDDVHFDVVVSQTKSRS